MMMQYFLSTYQYDIMVKYHDDVNYNDLVSASIIFDSRCVSYNVRACVMHESMLGTPLEYSSAAHSVVMLQARACVRV